MTFTSEQKNTMKEIAKEVVKEAVPEAVKETLSNLGMDMSEGKAEAQKDFIFMRKLRVLIESAWSKAFMVVAGVIATYVLATSFGVQIK